MTVSRSPAARAAAALVSLALVAACGSSGPTPAPSATASAAPPTPTATPSPTASATPGGGDANDAVYEEIEAQVRALRGLDAERPVERDVLDEQGLRDYVTTSFRKDNPEALVTGTEKLLKGLLLMPADESLEDLYIELLSSQVAGLYDDDTKQMYVVSRSGVIGPAEEITYAHEYTHALQDQRFDLRSIVGEDRDQGDRTLARTAVVEGDATLLMSLWAQGNLTAAELAEVAGSVDPASQEILDRMPRILADPLLFPYTAGLTLALTDFRTGGWSAVDDRYTNMPDSTEQVLHLDKLAAREAPVGVRFPDDLASRLGAGWKVSLQDTFGEFQLEILLRDAAGASGSDSTEAAAGWGGDRVALLEGPDGALGVVLDTAWDTDADAGEFANVLEGLVAELQGAGRAVGVFQPSSDRVVLVSASGADSPAADQALSRIANVLGLAG